MVKTPRSKKNKRQKRPFFLVSFILLAAAGAVLYRCLPSFQDISRMLQSAAGKISGPSAGSSPAEAVLRGTVYDRNLKELAVSYRLYSVLAHPGGIRDREHTVQALLPFANEKKEQLEARLKNAQYPVELIDDLDEKQARQIEELGLEGISCKMEEARFYPEHTAASHVLGFMGNGVGLAGVEGRYDALLRGGLFGKNSIADIDFAGQGKLGAAGVGLVLTLDIRLQKYLEQHFREYLAGLGAAKGMGLLLEPSSGRILALVNQPAFNPNYFWKAQEGSRVNRIYNHVLNRDLIRAILARAAAIERDGLGGRGVLPELVAAPDYGFTGKELDSFEKRIELYGSVFDNWESGPAAESQSGPEPVVTGVQVGVTLASLVNNGWRIRPYVIDSLYDYALGRRFDRDSEATEKTHVLDPALGIKIGRELFSDWSSEKENQIVFSADSRQLVPEHSSGKSLSNYSIQELFVGLTPVRQPRFLLLIAVEKDHLAPEPKMDKVRPDLVAIGRDMLHFFLQEGKGKALPEQPPARNVENLRQFLITRHLDFREHLNKGEEVAIRMPQVRGVSLRQGLQRLAPYSMKVRINGSGRIIAQYPLPGQPLAGVHECILTLDSR